MLMQGGATQIKRGVVVSLRCPGCRQIGTFDGFLEFDAQSQSGGRPCIAGLRLCPNPSCRALIFFVWDMVAAPPKLMASYPPERLDFDATNIPASYNQGVRRSNHLPRE